MNMFKLGLTGSIATGKTTALNAFANLGHATFSADEAVHELYKGEAVEPIAAISPAAINRGTVDRKRLSALIAKDPDLLAQINQIVHPLVQNKITTFLASAASGGKKLAVIDIPLLYEGGREEGFDAVAVTWCTDELQKNRALARPEMNMEKLQLILAHQKSQSDKKQRADFLIDTNGSIEETKRQVASIAQECLARAVHLK